MKVAVLTLMPEMFTAITQSGITSRAIEQRKIQLALFNPRSYTADKHKTVDDRPYGGGPGMVMKVEPLAKALAASETWHMQNGLGESEKPHVVYLSPHGQKISTTLIDEELKNAHLTLIAGRYEGLDQRFIDAYVDDQWSVGDVVLSGGELPAMIALDAMIRKLPGALGDSESAEQDSFENGLLDCPHYTRPERLEFEGYINKGCDASVPQVLMSGDHKKIQQWRRERSLLSTQRLRPDLLESAKLSEDDKKILAGEARRKY